MHELERQEVVAGLIAMAKGEVTEASVNAAALSRALAELERLAARRHLWSDVYFPAPDGDERQSRYLISEEPNRTFAVYLNVMRPGKLIPPHNHTTWACVAAVEGCEYNYVYERLDDKTIPDYARIRQSGIVRVEPGKGIALLPEDIHAVEIKGTDIIRHLHFYGRALETLHERLTFDIANNTCKPMQLSVQTKR